MRSICIFGSVVAVITACGSDEDVKASGCEDITGNYSVTSARSSGTCDPALDPTGTSTVTLARNATGWDLFIPGIEGACPGTLNASCRFVANCVATDKTTAKTLATYSIDYTFANATLSGSSVTSLAPPTVPSACDATYREQGSRL